MTRCLAVLAWRLSERGDAAPMRALCAASTVGADEMMILGAREHALWFPGSSPLPAPEPLLSPSTGTPDDERSAFALVNALNKELETCALRAFDLDDSALFAFTTGIHPAYVWPEALLSHEFFTAAGWLGHFWRRGRADMPADLAEYFDDVLGYAEDGQLRMRDRHLARFLWDPNGLAEVHRAVMARRAGQAAVAIWPESPSWSVAGANATYAPSQESTV